MNQELNGSVFNEPPKKKSSAPLIILLFLLIIGGVGAYLYFGTDIFKKEEPKKEENKQQEKQEEKKEEKKEEVTSSLSGEYEKDGKVIILFEKSKRVVMLEYENGDIALDVTSDGLKYGSFDEECIIKVNGTELTVTSNNMAGLESGTYKKTKEYTKEKYYEDHYGNSEYLTSKYTGQFTNGKKYVDMYQTEKDEVRVNIVSQNNNSYIGYEHDFKIQADGSLKEDDGSTITINGDKITVSLTNKEYSKDLDGEYTKSKELTIDYILENY